MTPFKKLVIAALSIVFSLAAVSSFAQVNDKGDELHKEIKNKNTEKIKQIIDKDISLLEIPNIKGSTPLTVAASFGHTEIVKYFIKKGANINACNNYGNTPLHYAAWASDFDSFKALRENGAILDIKNTQGQTPLQYACMGGNLEIFKYCVSNGIDVNAKIDDGSSIMHWAAYGGNIEIFKYLESKGIDANIKDKDGSPPLFWAASGKRQEMVKYLIGEKKSDINQSDNKGNTPLSSAIQAGSLEISQYLLEKGANINQKLEDNKTLLMFAAQANNPDLIQLLIDKGCDVNAFDDFGSTALINACGHGNFESVKALIKNSAKLNPGLCKRETCTNSGHTPLHAASFWYPEIVEYLLEKGADVNVKNLEGETPLHYAVGSDSTRIVAILCENGANVNLKNKQGVTPVVKAVQRQKSDALDIMLKYKADLSIADNDGKTALHYAAIAGNGKMAEYLVSKGPDINAKDNNGHGPAYYAAYYGNNKIAKKLILSGSNAEEMPKEMIKLLKKDLNMGEAVVWYLNHSGWAVKTKNHLLVFDYWQRSEDPDFACIDNGWINPEEIAGLNVIVFVSHKHQDHYMASIFDWSKTVNNINYVLGFNTVQDKKYSFIAPRSESVIDGVKITAVKSTDSGEGFMIESDGVTIFHAGDHANRYEEGDKEFTEEIDFLASNYRNINIAFIPVSGCNFDNKTALAKGNKYLVGKFNPAIVFPMHSSSNEIKLKEYADNKNKEDNTNIYKYVLQKGDRLLLKNGHKKTVGL